MARTQLDILHKNETWTDNSTPLSQMVHLTISPSNYDDKLEMEIDVDGDKGCLADPESKGQADGVENPPTASEIQTTAKSEDDIDVVTDQHESILNKGDADNDVEIIDDIPNDERMEEDNHAIDTEPPIANNNPIYGYFCMPATISEAFDSERSCTRMELLQNIRGLNVPDFGDQNLSERELGVICDKILSKTDSSSEGEPAPKKQKLGHIVEMSGTKSGYEESDVDTGRVIEILDISEVEGLEGLVIREVNSSQ